MTVFDPRTPSIARVYDYLLGGVSAMAGTGSSGVPHDAEDGEDGTRDFAAGFRSRLTTLAIASMVSIP